MGSAAINRMVRRLLARAASTRRALAKVLMQWLERLRKWLGRKANDTNQVNAMTGLREVFQLGYTRFFNLSAHVQAMVLGVRRIVASIRDRRDVAAASYAELAAERAIAALQEDCDIPSYALWVSGVLEAIAIAYGFELTGVALGGRYKRFTRFANVREPRGHHASLEGKIIPADRLWNLGGYRVPAPHHASLPLRERIGCRHINIYANNKAQLR